MPTCLLEAYVEQMDRVNAERMIDLAQASMVPHMTKGGMDRWWSQQQRRLRRPEPIAHHRRSAFFWNGEPVGPGRLKGELARALGGGFSRD